MTEQEIVALQVENRELRIFAHALMRHGKMAAELATAAQEVIVKSAQLLREARKLPCVQQKPREVFEKGAFDALRGAAEVKLPRFVWPDLSAYPESE